MASTITRIPAINPKSCGSFDGLRSLAGITLSAKMVYLELVSLANNEGISNASEKVLCERLGITRSEVRNHLDELIKNVLISKIGDTRYIFRLQDWMNKLH